MNSTLNKYSRNSKDESTIRAHIFLKSHVYDYIKETPSYTVCILYNFNAENFSKCPI